MIGVGNSLVCCHCRILWWTDGRNTEAGGGDGVLVSFLQKWPAASSSFKSQLLKLYREEDTGGKKSRGQ